MTMTSRHCRDVIPENLQKWNIELDWTNHQTANSKKNEGIFDGYSIQLFLDASEVLGEIEAAGYFPLTLDFPAESNDDHWHNFDSMDYIFEGEITIFDTETGESCVCGAGTKIMAPCGVLHREKTLGHNALIAFSIDPAELTQPVNTPLPVTLG